MESDKTQHDSFAEYEPIPNALTYDGSQIVLTGIEDTAYDIQERPVTYLLAEHFDVFGTGEHALISVDSSRGGLDISALLTLDNRIENGEDAEHVRTAIAQIDEDTLARYGLRKELGFHSKYLAFRGRSSVAIGVEIEAPKDSTSLAIRIGTQFDSDDFVIESPFIERVDSKEALQDFASFWLIATREAEKVLSINPNGGSQIDIEIQPLLMEDSDYEIEQAGEDNSEAPAPVPELETLPTQDVAQIAEQEVLAEELAEEERGISFDDIGGNLYAKQKLLELVHGIKHPEVMQRWGIKRPSGVLLYGPPGTGKSSLVYAFANEIEATLWPITSDMILRKYTGESEANIREIFDDANKITSPTVMFFDEIDSIIKEPARSNSGVDAILQRVAGIFKQEIEKLSESNPNVILVATTNYIDSLSDAIKRSGRFDVHIAVPLPNQQDRAEIFNVLLSEVIIRLQSPLSGQNTISITDFTETRFLAVDTDIDVHELAAKTEGLSGADIRSILDGLLYTKAILEAKTGLSEPITQADLLQAIRVKRQQ